MNFPKAFNGRIKKNEPLKKHTSLKIGGKARYWYEPKNRSELAQFLRELTLEIPIFVIGSGSNILVNEGLINKIFVCLRRGDFIKAKITGCRVLVGAGLSLGGLVSLLCRKNLGGYEFLAGIPGTVGGAIAMNAGSRNDFSDSSSYKEIKDIVSYIEVLDRKGNFKKIPRSKIKFSYRKSSLKKYIIIAAEFKLFKSDISNVRKRIKNNIRLRMNSQDWAHPSAGSFFKNPSKDMPAAKLIDMCGLKGRSVGGAQVSDKHANFIINKSSAKSGDVLKLMEIIQKSVYNQFNIALKPEVEFVS